jgi:hypothetical protein
VDALEELERLRNEACHPWAKVALLYHEALFLLEMEKISDARNHLESFKRALACLKSGDAEIHDHKKYREVWRTRFGEKETAIQNACDELVRVKDFLLDVDPADGHLEGLIKTMLRSRWRAPPPQIFLGDVNLRVVRESAGASCDSPEPADLKGCSSRTTG